MGEPAGIGPEVAIAAFHALDGHAGNRPLMLVGDDAVFAACGAVPTDAVIATKARAVRVPGRPDSANAAAISMAIRI